MAFGTSRGGGRGRGRSGGRGGRGGGRSNYQGGGNQGPNLKTKFNICKDFTKNQQCPNGAKCYYSHSFMQHGVINASNKDNNTNQFAKISSVALWQSPDAIKIFTASYDGFWRLWNTAGGNFHKEFEHNMGGQIECIKVVQNRLYVAFLGTSPAIQATVGMVHVWDLANPGQPPKELHMEPLLPYAHNTNVTCVYIADNMEVLVTGAQDGSIRIWNNQTLQLQASLPGHAGGVSGLALTDPKTLWSTGLDKTIRVWDISTQKCQHVLAPSNGGHQDAVTSLLKFEMNGANYLLTGSLDGSIKAWDASNGQCIVSEDCTESIICMAIIEGQHPILLVGLLSGSILGRNLVQTPKSPAFEALFLLKLSNGHRGPVQSISTGPSQTFYSVGQSDGNLRVYQIGDLGLA